MTMKAIPALLLAALLLPACGKDAAEPAGKPGAAAPQEDIDAAIEKGLVWLRGQAEDGRWMMNMGDQRMPSPATTALALTPIAAALPPAERATDPLVRNAAAFILSAQRDDGAISAGPVSYFENYFTSASLMALSVVNDPGTAKQRQKMRTFLLQLQRMEEGRTKGGFGYNKRQGADLSNAQFAIEALRSAGVPEDHESMKQARRFLERMQNRSENEANKDAAYEMEDEQHGKVKVVPGNDGSAGYEPGVSKAGLHRLPDGTFVPRGYGSMTYALLKCYLLTGLPKDDERVQAAIGWLAKNYSWDENPGFRIVAKEIGRKDAPYWGLFYYYMTAAKALRLSGLDTLDTPDGPRNWRKDLAAAIVARQRDDGSWINDQSQRWEEADPIITTAYALIALQEIQAR